MARAGLGAKWLCLFANDVDALKASTYQKNWGSTHFDDRDICLLRPNDLEGIADLAWASFPCQDLSVAGKGYGVGVANNSHLTRSGVLWPFLYLVQGLRQSGRQPSLIVLENVIGLLTLDKGRDFASICLKLQQLDYCYGAVVIDAKNFVPQSRPRVFIVAVKRGVSLPSRLVQNAATREWHPPALIRAYDALCCASRSNWIWWDLAIAPALPNEALSNVIEIKGVEWNSTTETKRFLEMMAPAHIARLDEAKASRLLQIGSLYHRMRREGSTNRQRAEIAFGPTLGCLRTPRGGASRPRIVMVKNEVVKTRLLSIEEASKLMGLPPKYILPECYYHAFKVIGDGLVVPTVRFLAKRLLEPLAIAARTSDHDLRKVA